MALKFTSNYDNPYEAAYNLLRNNAWFNQTDWDTHARRGELEQYVNLLSQTDKLPAFDEMSKEYRFDVLDTDRRFFAMANELNGDKTNTTEKRTEDYWDEATQSTQTREFEMSDYDYNKYLLMQYRDFKIANEERQREQQRKDEMNGLVKFLATIPATAGELVLGVTDFFDDIFSLIEGIGDGLDASFNGESFLDGFRQAYTDPDWRLFSDTGFGDALKEWESKYSYMRDIDGNYTGVGQFLGGVSYSLGKALPSMALNLVGGAAAANVASKSTQLLPTLSQTAAGTLSGAAAITSNVSKAATAIYYIGLGSGTFNELANNPNLATVPTEKLILNAAIKTGVEYLMQVGMTKAFGGATIKDSLIFGQATQKIVGKGLFKQGLKRYAIDFLHEGLEELTQEYGSWLVDRFFAIGDQRFSDLTVWNVQTMFDAFILGGLSTIGTNIMKTVATGRVDIGGKKLSKLASMEYKVTLADMMTEFKRLQNDQSLTTSQMQDIAGQLYVSMRTIAGVYGEIGAERFSKATELLNQIKAANISESDIIKNTQKMMNVLTEISEKYAEDAAKKDIEKKLKKAGITDVDRIFKRADIDELDDPELRKKFEDILDADPSIKNIVTSQDGSTIVIDEDTIFVPIDYIHASKDANGIYKLNAEQTLVENTVNATYYQHALARVAEIYKQVTGDSNADIEKVVYNLFFNDVFQDILLANANREVYELVSHLDKIEAAATRKTRKDAIYKERIKNVRKQLGIKIAQYLIYQQTADYQSLDILTKEQKAYIAKMRWSRDLANRVLEGKKLSADDVRLLTERVNRSPMSAEMKQKTIDALLSDNKVARSSALASLEAFYENQFNSPYDNKTYLADNSLQNVMFNEFLKLSGLTLKTLFKIDKNSDLYQQIEANHDVVNRETILAFLRNRFKEFTNAQYDFTVVKGAIQIHKMTPEQQRGFNDYSIDRKIRAHDNDITNRTLITPKVESEVAKIIGKALNKDLDEVSRANVTLHDMIFDSENLTKTIRGEIAKEPGGLTPINTFLYLRQLFLSESGGTTSIVVTADGRFALVNVAPMANALIDADVKNPANIEQKVNNKTEYDYRNDEQALRIVKKSHGHGNLEYGFSNTDMLSPDNIDTEITKYEQKIVQLQQEIDEMEQLVNDESIDFDKREQLRKGRLANFKDILKHTKVNLDVTKELKSYYETKKSVTPKEVKTEYKISDFIKADYLQGRLADIVVRLVDDTQYLPLSNVIEIDRNSDDALFRFGLMHEFQHAIQFENNLNSGLSANWLYYLTTTMQRKIVKDVREHKPELFRGVKKGSKQELVITSNFVYDTTGETQAYGMEGSPIVDYYPTVVKSTRKEITVTLPWGNKYNITENVQSVQKGLSSVETKINDYAQTVYKPEMKPNSLSGFIFSDGYIGFSDTMFAHQQFYMDLHEKFSTGVDEFADSLIEIGFNGRFGHGYVDQMSIRINGNSLNVDQKAALYDFVNDMLANDVSLEIEHVPTGRVVYSNIGDYNGGRLLAQLGRIWGNAFGTSSMSMSQPGDKRSRRITTDVWKDTRLKYFDKRKLIDPAIQDFVVNTNKLGLEPAIEEKISGSEKGTLTKTWLMDWFKDADTINEYTFKKIKQYFFEDSKVNSFETLQFIEANLSNYYVMSIILEKIGRSDWLDKRMSKETFFKYVNQVMQDKRTAALFKKLSASMPILDATNVRKAIMKEADGTIASIARLVNKAKAASIIAKRKRGNKSLNADVADGLTLEEVLADESAQADFNERLSEVTRKDMVDKVYEYTLEQTESSGIHLKEAQRKALYTTIESKSDDVLEAMFSELDIADTFDIEPSFTIDVTASKSKQIEIDKEVLKNTFVKKSINYQASIRQFGRTIINNVSPKEFKKLPSDIQEMFDNGKLKQEVYQGKTREELLQLKDYLREIAVKVKRGEFDIKSDKVLQKEIKELKRDLKKAQKDAAKYSRQAASNEVKDISIGNHEFRLKTNIAMPSILNDMLNVSFNKFARTDVKYLSEENEQHVKMSYNSFIEKTATMFAMLTQADVDEIINFYSNSSLQFTDEYDRASYIKYQAFEIFTLGTLVEQARHGDAFVLSANQAKVIESTLATLASGGATIMTSFKSILPKINPAAKIIQSMAKVNGIEFDEKLVNNMIDAMSKQDIAKVKQIRAEMYKDVLDKAKTRKVKRSVWDKLLSFERMAMLSSPGTWARNIASNVMVSASNVIGDVIGKAFSKVIDKFKKPIEYSQKQYTITGIKVDDKTYKFVNEQIVDSGLLELIRDGISKYDIRKSNKLNVSDRITQAIMRSVENEVFGKTFDSKIFGGAEQFISKILGDWGDQPFINKRVKSYIGKMLVEDNINLDNGITAEVEEVIVNAYTLAAYDYMHKPNAFNKLEQALKNKSEAAYFAYKQLMPFASASWNWFVEGLSYTPVGLIKGIIELTRIEKTINKLEDARQKGETVVSSRFAKFIALRHIGKGVLGSITLGIGLLLGGFGIVQVDNEDDKLKLKFGDTYIDISSLTGMQGVLLGIALTNPRKGNFEKALIDVADTIFTDSTIDSLYNLFRYSDSAGDFVLSSFTNTLNMFVPNALKLLSNSIQVNKVRYDSGILGQLERFATGLMPGLSYAFPTRIDPYTGKVQSKYSVPFAIDFYNRLSPIKIYNYGMTNMEKLAIELGVNKSELTGRYQDIGTLSTNNKTKLNQKYGELNEKDLANFVNNKVKYEVEDTNGRRVTLSYTQMTDVQRANVIQRIMNANAKYSKIYVYTTSMNGKYYASSSEYNALKKLKITQNVYRETTNKKGFN